MTTLSSAPDVNDMRKIIKSIEFTGANNLGELDQPTVTVFTVTGEVVVALLLPYCTEDFASAGGGTLLLGVTGDTDLFIASTTATDLDNGKFWVDATPIANGVAIPAALKDVAITDNVIMTVGTADITDGTLRFTLYWLPISADGNVA